MQGMYAAPPAAPAPAPAPAAVRPDALAAELLQLLQTGDGRPAAPGPAAAPAPATVPPAPAAPPATAAAGEPFAAQLRELEDMGFTDRAQNLRALQAVGGNVDLAVDRLLSGA